MMNTIEEMICIVQLYIHHRKEKEVQISINNTRDLFLLNKAYVIALKWLNENNFKQL
jgi:hypothetical protein